MDKSQIQQDISPVSSGIPVRFLREDNIIPVAFDSKVVTETVGGVEFVYPTTQTLLFYGVYNEENCSLFNTLGWAFERGCLTHDDLLEISGNYVSGTTVSVA